MLEEMCHEREKCRPGSQFGGHPKEDPETKGLVPWACLGNNPTEYKWGRREIEAGKGGRPMDCSWAVCCFTEQGPPSCWRPSAKSWKNLSKLFPQGLGSLGYLSTTRSSLGEGHPWGHQIFQHPAAPPASVVEKPSRSERSRRCPMRKAVSCGDVSTAAAGGSPWWAEGYGHDINSTRFRGVRRWECRGVRRLVVVWARVVRWASWRRWHLYKDSKPMAIWRKVF